MTTRWLTSVFVCFIVLLLLAIIVIITVAIVLAILTKVTTLSPTTPCIIIQDLQNVAAGHSGRILRQM